MQRQNYYLMCTYIKKKVKFGVNQSIQIRVDSRNFQVFFATQSDIIVLHNERPTRQPTDRTKLRLSGESWLMLHLLFLRNLVRITSQGKKLMLIVWFMYSYSSPFAVRFERINLKRVSQFFEERKNLIFMWFIKQNKWARYIFIFEIQKLSILCLA